MERRLTAILAADVVGYTRLMRADEEGTLQRLTTLREGILEPLIADQRGRVQRLLKVDGNALLLTEITFEVCGEDAELGSINYFRPIDPLDSYNIDQLLDHGEDINQSQLAWRIADKQPEKPGDRPPGRAANAARELRYRWGRAGLIETFDGPKSAKMMRRKSAEVERA